MMKLYKGKGKVRKRVCVQLGGGEGGGAEVQKHKLQNTFSLLASCVVDNFELDFFCLYQF